MDIDINQWLNILPDIDYVSGPLVFNSLPFPINTNFFRALELKKYNTSELIISECTFVNKKINFTVSYIWKLRIVNSNIYKDFFNNIEVNYTLLEFSVINNTSSFAIEDINFLRVLKNLEHLELVGFCKINLFCNKKTGSYKLLSLMINQTKETCYVDNIPEESVFLETLKGLPNLQLLHIKGLKNKDLSFLTTLKKLEEVILENSEVDTISEIIACKHLKRLTIHSAKNLLEINLKDFKKLIFIEVSDCENLTTLTLPEASTPLVCFSLFNTAVVELTFKAFKSLQHITIVKNAIKKVSFIDLPSLETITVSNNLVESIYIGEKEFESLKELNLSYNQIKSIEDIQSYIAQFRGVSMYWTGNKFNS